MFEIKNNKVFMDAVHGYINVPKCFINNLVDTEYFQRLRNIDQTGMRILYPNAKHDRFSHSLGVFHLGQKAANTLLENFSQDQYWNNDKYQISNSYWAKNKILFLIACLLHDLGHAPFSHSLEDIVLKNSIIQEGKGKKAIEISVSEKLKDNISKFENEYNKFCENDQFQEPELDIRAAAHEQMGAMLVFSEDLQGAIKQIYNDLINQQYLIRKVEDTDSKSKAEFNDDLCFIARMILGIKYDDWHPRRQIRNCFIELLNGENFDVDKLDYIVRDTHMSGISNVSVDVERLLSSLCIVTKTRYLEKEIPAGKTIENLTATTITNLGKTDEFMFDGHINGKLLLKKGTTVAITQDSEILALKGINDEYASIAYTSGKTAIFTNESFLKIKSTNTSDGIITGETNVNGFGNDLVKQLRGEVANTPFNVIIQKATTKNDFIFRVREDSVIELFGHCNIKIKGMFQSVGSIKLFSPKNIHGTVSELEILGDAFKEPFTSSKEATVSGYNTFSIGFKKQAINVVANVLDARNYLYLWIYAHHKVTYYANFLVPILSQYISEIINKKDIKAVPETSNNKKGNNALTALGTFPFWNLNYNNIKNLDDYYIWTAIRFLHNNLKIDKNVKRLTKQVMNHCYDTSMYKSLAEYEAFFETFSDEKRKNMVSFLQQNTNKKLCYISAVKNGKSVCNCGYLKANILKEINLHISNVSNSRGIDVFELERLCFVMVDYKLKQLDTQKVYIEMGDEIVPISQLPLLENQAKKSKQKSNNYFYLYYHIKDTDKILDKNKTNTIIKEAIKLFFESKI